MHLLARRQTGFTLVEVMVALVVTAIGLGALAGSSALVTRMIGRGARASRAAEVAEGRVEQLRAAAGSTTPRCISPAFGSGGPLSSRGVAERWEVGPVGAVRNVRAIVSSPIPGGIRVDTLQGRIDC